LNKWVQKWWWLLAEVCDVIGFMAEDLAGRCHFTAGKFDAMAYKLGGAVVARPRMTQKEAHAWFYALIVLLAIGGFSDGYRGAGLGFILWLFILGLAP
jgi:hypothetical protein